MKRRSLLKGGLALPLIPFGLTSCWDTSSDINHYLQANFGPVDVESTITDLEVTGSIPAELVWRQ